MGFELHRAWNLGLYPDSEGMYVGLMGYGVLTFLTGFLWCRFLRGCLQNYPGSVSLWVWRKDHAEASVHYTVACGLACAWSVYHGSDCLTLHMPAMAVFYFGCTSLWVSLRAVALAQLPVIDPSDLRLRGALALTDRR